MVNMMKNWSRLGELKNLTNNSNLSRFLKHRAILAGPPSTRISTSTDGNHLLTSRNFSSSTKLGESRVTSVDNNRGVEFPLSGKGKDREIAEIFDDAVAWRSRLDTTGTRLGLFRRTELLQPDGFEPWLHSTIKQAQVLVELISQTQTEREAKLIVKRLDRLSDLLCSLIDLSEFVRSLHPSPHYSSCANQAYLKMVSYMNQLNTTPQLYHALKKVLDTPAIYEQFGEEELEVAYIFLRDFEKSGIHLGEAQRRKFVALNDDINELGRHFLSNPQPRETSLRLSRVEVEGCEGWWNVNQSVNQIPTSPGHASMFLRTARHSSARKKMYLASNTPGSQQEQVLEELLLKRADLAELLGHGSYADFFLADKMARSTQSVQAFLDELSHQNRGAVNGELQILRNLQKTDSTASGNLEAWDQSYYTHQYEQSLRNKTSGAISAYFSVGTVVQGLSDLLCQLYGIRFKPVSSVPLGELWDPSVRKLQVEDEQTGQLVGMIYLDLFSRPGKPTTAAHYTIQCSRRLDFDHLDEVVDPKVGLPLPGTSVNLEGKSYQVPVVVLSCAFANPTVTPSLLEPSEVETLFHEMGHAIHSMLARTEFHNVAGTRCKIDFVEFPSIFLESFALAPGIVANYARHYATGAPLPAQLLFHQLEASRALRSLDTQHQILLSILDQEYHRLRPGVTPGFSAALLPSIAEKYAPIFSLPQPAFGFKFGHLFAYSASYYTYLLGRTLAGQMWQTGFSKFSSDQVNPHSRDEIASSGHIIRQEILRWGGGRDPWHCVAAALDALRSQRGTSMGEAGASDLTDLTHPDPARAMKVVGRWGLPPNYHL